MLGPDEGSVRGRDLRPGLGIDARDAPARRLGHPEPVVGPQVTPLGCSNPVAMILAGNDGAVWGPVAEASCADADPTHAIDNKTMVQVPTTAFS